MNIKKMFLCAVILFASVVSLQAQIKTGKQLAKELAEQVQKISVEQLKEQMNSGKTFFLIDIRTQKEYEAGHIDGATWIPRGKLEFSLPELTSQTDAVIVLYCRSGSRSTLANFSLKQMGYTHVSDLDGGFSGWLKAGMPAFNMHGEFSLLNAEKKESSWHQ